MDLDVHVVSHTHWDREWYHPVERFRQRLVELVDDLLDAPPASDESFLLDGQTILLDDYLAVRPEREQALATLLRDGRLEAGPWFVLADELIPGGEALVRNLLMGRRILRRFGAQAPPVLYCPDSFGHPAALPAIAAGFGLPLVILWRGYGGRATPWPEGDTVRWEAPGGASVLLFHLPRDGYEFGARLPLSRTEAADRWDRMRRELVPRSATGVLLVPNGADHHARQPGLDRALDTIEAAAAPDGVHRSSLRAFTESLIGRADPVVLPVVRGELRDSYGYTWTLQGTCATRAHEKRANARAEQLLIRDVEPWTALAACGHPSRAALVRAAWRDLLAAHPHDTLCGCSLDDVALAMEGRIRSAVAQGEGIRDDALLDLIGYDASSARDRPEQWRPVVVLRNPAARVRSGVAIVDVEEFLTDVPVGPGAAAAPARGRPAAAPRRTPLIPDLGPVQVLVRGTRYSRIEAPDRYPDNDLVATRRVAVWISDAPAYGVTTHPLGPPEAGVRRQPRPPGPRAPVVTGERSLENAVLKVQVGDDGVVSLEETATGRRVASLIELVDETDAGDLYTPSPRPRAFSVTCRGIRRTHRGPLYGEIAVRYRVTGDGSARTLADLELRLALEADAPFLRIAVQGDNRGRDHRLRLVLHGPVAAGDVWADAAFGPVLRRAIVLPELPADAGESPHVHLVTAPLGASSTAHSPATPARAGGELPPPTAPLHRYVTCAGERDGFTVFSDGLAEYEAHDDAVLVTLVRAVGELSRNDLPERPGHAGWPVPTPGAQCLGELAARLAVMVHGPRTPSVIDAIERAADDVLLPLAGSTLRSAIAPAARVEGVTLEGDGLAFSACKESEDGQWLVLRCVNLLDAGVAGTWRLPFEISEARAARLDETPEREVPAQGGELRFVAGPRAVVTILIRAAALAPAADAGPD